MDRFILQQSETPGWLVATDKDNGIVVRFKCHEYNETQQVTLLNGDTFKTAEDAVKVATYIRELADWLRLNHYDKVFYSSFRELVGNQLREIRKSKGLTGREVANLAGMKESTISKIEYGRWSVSLDVLEKVCNALGVTIKIQ